MELDIEHLQILADSLQVYIVVCTFRNGEHSLSSCVPSTPSSRSLRPRQSSGPSIPAFERTAFLYLNQHVDRLGGHYENFDPAPDNLACLRQLYQEAAFMATVGAIPPRTTSVSEVSQIEQVLPSSWQVKLFQCHISAAYSCSVLQGASGDESRLIESDVDGRQRAADA